MREAVEYGLRVDAEDEGGGLTPPAASAMSTA